MKNIKFKYLALSLFLLIFTISVKAQEIYRLNVPNSKLIITGTSSIHDWEVEAEKFNCETSVEKIDATTIAIHKIDFTCKAEDIKSHNRIMENKTHDALKKKEFPEITFKLQNTENIQTGGENVMIKGKLTIAGKTKEIQLPSLVKFANETNFSVTGEVPLKLSGFDIEPPTAMMGALKTGDEIKIKYNFEFNKTPSN